jgi:hypothetical protein
METKLAARYQNLNPDSEKLLGAAMPLAPSSLAVEPLMHWFAVPQAMIVQLSASERQSGVVLGKFWDQKFWRGRIGNYASVAGEMLFRPSILLGTGLLKRWTGPGRRRQARNQAAQRGESASLWAISSTPRWAAA